MPSLRMPTFLSLKMKRAVLFSQIFHRGMGSHLGGQKLADVVSAHSGVAVFLAAEEFMGLQNQFAAQGVFFVDK